MVAWKRKSEPVGRGLGWMMAPFFGLVSFVRRARTFHPRGPTFHAVVEVHELAPLELRALAERLSGHALVRFSGALWKHAEGIPDVLGCAIRLRRDARDTAEPSVDDQDLLFATIRRPWTMPLSPLSTDVSDYLANDYFAVSPFEMEGSRARYLRLHPAQPSSSAIDGTRAERLACEVARGDARLTLGVSDGPWGPWTPVVSITLERAAEVDGESLRFRPMRDGRGVHPRGFVHALRRGVYAMSQRARPRVSASSA